MKKINLYNFIYIFLLFPFIKPTYLSVTYSFVDKIYGFWIVISFITILLIYVANKKKFSKICGLIFVYELILLVSTIINRVEIISALKELIKVIAFCLIVDYGVNKNIKSLLNALMFIFEINIYINFITILVFPNGMYVSELAKYTENYFLGYDNIHILYILPALLISNLHSYLYKNNKSKRTVLLYIICTFSVLLRWSATGVVGLSLILVFFAFNKFISNSNVFNIKNYIISYICLFFSIVIFRLQNLFSWLIVDILKKDLTFTNRTYVWDYILNFISKKPMIGYGIENNIDKLNKTPKYHTLHAHNQILEITYLGGFPLLITIVIIVYNTYKNIKQCNDLYLKNLFSWFILTYFIIMLTEAYDLDLVFFVFVIFYNIKTIARIKLEVKHE